MSLPKIQHPLHDFEILSLNKTVKLRPFTVKEEKIILLANTSDDVNDKLNAIIQIVNNCIVSESIDAEKLPSFDIERIFLKLRAISVDSKVEVQWVDEKDKKKKYTFIMDLEKIEVDGYARDANVIDLGSGIGVVLTYPPLKDIPVIYQMFKNYNETGGSIVELTDKFLTDYLVKVFDDNTVQVRGDDFNEDEIHEFVDNLHVAHAEKILDFFVKIPTTIYKTTIEKKDGTTEDITIRGILNFLA